MVHREKDKQKIKVGIIGSGNIASGYDEPSSQNILTHAHALTVSSEYELTGFYDIVKARAEKASTKWGGRVYETVEEMGNSNEILCIAVPDGAHFEILMKCLSFESIKAIIAEKPITSTLEQAGKIEKLYAGINTPLFVNYSRRYVKNFLEIRKWIERKGGNLIFGNCNYGKGVLHSSSHFINLFMMLFGEMKVEHVGREYVDYSKEDPSKEFVLGVNGAPIYFHVIPCNMVTEAGFELFFDKGKIKYDGKNETIEYFEVGDSAYYLDEKNYVKNRIDNIDVSSAMMGLYQNVFCNLNFGETIRCGLDDAIKTLLICDIILREESH